MHPWRMFGAGMIVAGLATFAVLKAQQRGTLTAMDFIEIQQLANRFAQAIDTCSNNGYDYAAAQRQIRTTHASLENVWGRYDRRRPGDVCSSQSTAARHADGDGLHRDSATGESLRPGDRYLLQQRVRLCRRTAANKDNPCIPGECLGPV